MDALEAQFVARTYECGPEGTIQLPALLQHMQEAAATHAEQLGFGTDKLGPINSFWVLWNLRIAIHRPPKWNEQYTIRTWPSGATRVIATREFLGLDERGDELFTAGTQWMVLNRNNDLPRNLRKVDIENIDTGPDTYSAGMDRLQPPTDCEPLQTIRVPHSAIDLNAHVNNTEYVRWALDALRQAQRPITPIRSLQVTFLSEVFEDDEMHLSAAVDDTSHVVLGRRQCDKPDVFVLRASV